MGDAAGQLAHRLHLLGVAQAVFGRLQGCLRFARRGHVDDGGQYPLQPSVGVPFNIERQVQIAYPAVAAPHAPARGQQKAARVQGCYVVRRVLRAVGGVELLDPAADDLVALITREV